MSFLGKGFYALLMRPAAPGPIGETLDLFRFGTTWAEDP